MNQEFVPYEIAKELKDLGFNGDCLAFYYYVNMPMLTLCEPDLYKRLEKKMPLLKAPLWQQAFQWFRDKHKLLALPLNIGGDWRHLYDIFVYDLANDKEIEFDQMLIESYEEAEHECLKQLIEIIRKNKEK